VIVTLPLIGSSSADKSVVMGIIAALTSVKLKSADHGMALMNAGVNPR
jgi:hypothetical protein